MTSLPKQSSTPASAMHISQATTHTNHREILYNADNQGRYAVQSYEVREWTRTESPIWQALQPTDNWPVLQSIERADLANSRSTSRSSVIVVQSREDSQLDKPGSKGMTAKLPKSAAPPPAPRPHRLSTPDLSDLDEDGPFCHCDAKKQCNSKGGCLRKKYRRALS
jgi:hypothetical protein